VAERIRKAIGGTPLDTHGKDVNTTVSIGIASFPDHGAELAMIMNRADQALYTSKNRGRNCCSISGGPQSARAVAEST
jgi:diguanylate cyclase (GGDEF)-like protein